MSSPELSSCGVDALVLLDVVLVELSSVLLAQARVAAPVDQVLLGRVAVIAAQMSGVSSLEPADRLRRVVELCDLLAHDGFGRRVLARVEARSGPVGVG